MYRMKTENHKTKFSSYLVNFILFYSGNSCLLTIDLWAQSFQTLIFRMTTTTTTTWLIIVVVPVCCVCYIVCKTVSMHCGCSAILNIMARTCSNRNPKSIDRQSNTSQSCINFDILFSLNTVSSSSLPCRFTYVNLKLICLPGVSPILIAFAPVMSKP